ncbi:hypothetical protein SESBI_20715 [Sesbania bispinosa]|nr:hypothetical protein SESBI_20715 [Sesbania bispinosa]
MDTYLTGFQGRNLVEPRFMSLDFFKTNGFQFQELLEYQGLNHFVSIQCPYLLELVKVFYCNLTISNGDLCSEVKGVKIRVRPCDWLSLAGLKFEGEKFELANIRSWENYDRVEAVKGMIKHGLQPPNKVNVGSLNVEDRLLHYTLARILIPHGSNYAQLTKEDIFVLWAMKEHTDNEGEVAICWSNSFDQAILNKMKIKQVEGVWQYANEIGIEKDNQAEDADEAPITDTDNVTHEHHFDNNLQHIMIAIQGLQLSMTNHHKKVEKMMEELVNRVHVIEDRLPPPTSG